MKILWSVLLHRATIKNWCIHIRKWRSVDRLGDIWISEGDASFMNYVVDCHLIWQQ